MPERSPRYSLVILMLVVALCLTYWARLRPAVALHGADLTLMPTRLGSWTQVGADLKPDEETLSGWSIQPRDFLMRTYASPDGASIELLTIYKGLDRRGWHMSEMCFTGSGLNVKQSNITVQYAGKDIPAVKLLAEDHRFDTSMVTVYLLVQGTHGETNYLKQQLVMALSRLSQPKEGWAYVRVTCPVSTSEEDAMQHIRDFLKHASVSLVTALATPAGGSSGP